VPSEARDHESQCGGLGVIVLPAGEIPKDSTAKYETAVPD
jgi:hypothetical protein